MKNQAEIQERFFKENGRMKLGHLASDLARIASLLGMQAEGKTLEGVMRESKFFAEWAAKEADLELQMLLAEIQGFVAQKELELNFFSSNLHWKRKVRDRLRTWSDELLKKAGFLNLDDGRN